MAFKKSSKMEFHWNYNTGGIVQRKGFGADTNKVFADTLVKYGEEFTPMKSGALRLAVTVKANPTNAKIQYPGIKYADYQYNADDSTWNRFTPGTTSRWLDYAWQVYKAQITGTVGAYRRWHSK